MYLSQQKLQHINSITHESKVVVFATDADGKISYTVKQDGFEDSYLNTPSDQRTGWENWKSLEFPNEANDQSVIDKETAKLTHQKDTSNFILRSRYKTQTETAVTPVQAISALGHIYVFRQSKSNTLLVDRFVLDGMTNKLNRKLEVRFKRSKQKHTPTKNMNKGSNGLVNIDTLDFRDANGNFFYEPTTELCLVNNLHKGWFSAVLVPTIENDVYRWHIFAYNSQTQKIELTTIRTSEEGLFDVQDYTIFEELNESLVPRRISGIIKRTLDINSVTITNGLAATQYDLQQAQQTQSGEEQLLKTATRLMLAIPTNKGTAAFSFAIGGDGTLAEIDETPESKIIRSQQREVLLPLNTLDEIKAIGDRTPAPQGIITGLAEGTDEENIEDLVKISTNGKAADLANDDLVKITGTNDYQGLYRTTKIDEHTFEIDLPSGNGLGYWEKEDPEEGGLIFDGMITAYQKTANGKLRVTCENHGLENGDEVQIMGTEDYNSTYPVQKIDDNHFVIEHKWAMGEAINVKRLSQKRRGVLFDGINTYVSLPEMNHDFSQGFTVEAWVWYDSFKPDSRIIDFGDGSDANNILFCNEGSSNTLRLRICHLSKEQVINAPGVLETGKWIHLAATIDTSGTAKLYKNGEQIQTGEIQLPNLLKGTKNYIARSSGSDDGYFNGKLSDLRIWKVARTAADIKNNMYLQLRGKELGLVGYWRLGAIAEGKVVDFSVNCNDGIVHGDVYVSATTLNRKLSKGINAVKYSNSELFAVSERATYEETFEFKVNSATTVDLDYLDNADGKNLGTKIFTISYWGKSSRSAEEKQIIAPEQIKQDKFEDLGKGWYRVCCNVTIPDGVSLLRSFEIVNVKGNWQSLEIRKHRIRLLSESITEAKYTDNVALTPLVEQKANLPSQFKPLKRKQQEEEALRILKSNLEQERLVLANFSQKEIEVTQVSNKIVRLQDAQCQYQNTTNDLSESQKREEERIFKQKKLEFEQELADLKQEEYGGTISPWLLEQKLAELEGETEDNPVLKDWKKLRFQQEIFEQELVALKQGRYGGRIPSWKLEQKLAELEGETENNPVLKDWKKLRFQQEIFEQELADLRQDEYGGRISPWRFDQELAGLRQGEYRGIIPSWRLEQKLEELEAETEDNLVLKNWKKLRLQQEVFEQELAELRRYEYGGEISRWRLEEKLTELAGETEDNAELVKWKKKRLKQELNSSKYGYNRDYEFSFDEEFEEFEDRLSEEKITDLANLSEDDLLQQLKRKEQEGKAQVYYPVIINYLLKQEARLKQEITTVLPQIQAYIQELETEILQIEEEQRNYQPTLYDCLQSLDEGERQEAVLLKEKRELEFKIAAYNAEAKTRAKVEQLKAQIITLISQESALLSKYNEELESPFNYYCSIRSKQSSVVLDGWGGNCSVGTEVKLHGLHSGDNQLWKFIPQNNGFFAIQIKQRSLVLDGWGGNCGVGTDIKLNGLHGGDNQLWKFISQSNGFFVIEIKQNSLVLDGWGGRCYSGTLVKLNGLHGGDNQLWKLQKTSEQANTNISDALAALNAKQKELLETQKELANLEKILTATPADKAAWDLRLAQVIQEIITIQTELNILNNDFLNAVKTTQQIPQMMPEIAKNGRGLVTQGALLSFVNPASRLNAIETCEGNVQLSYFDTQGRMRQTNYDVTADGNNATFEEWVPDAQRACLNLSNSNGIVKLNQPLYLLPNWSIEAWFVYPLPETEEWNTLITGEKGGCHIGIKNRKKLGIYLHNDSLEQYFYESGFNMQSLTEGWHHLTAVGRGDTTEFYIDGKKVGDTKAKALADAKQSLDKTSSDAAAKKKLEEIKKKLEEIKEASLKDSSNIGYIGNSELGKQQFGKVAEVRIWGVALSDEEIMVNSKTLLSGNEPGLLAYYPMNEATGEIVRDRSGNSNHGTASSPIWWGCTAPIGNPGNTAIEFDGVNDHVVLPDMNYDFSKGITVEAWVWYEGFNNWSRIIDFGNGVSNNNILLTNEGTSGDLHFGIHREGAEQLITAKGALEAGIWMHLTATIDASGNGRLYKNGKQIQAGKIHLPETLKRTQNYIGKSNWPNDKFFMGKLSNVRIWNKARTKAEIQADMCKPLIGKEPNLVAYYPLDEIQPKGTTRKVLDLAGNNHGIVNEAIAVDNNTLPIGGHAIVSGEYSTVTLENNSKIALMRRFFAYPTTNGAILLPDKRVEALELKWIGNAQFAPTLLGYIEGAPPVPSENFTVEYNNVDDYNGATSVELTMSEDVAFSWNRSQDVGLGGSFEFFGGSDKDISGGSIFYQKKMIGTRAGFKGNFDFSYQFQNASNITSTSSLSMTDKLELHGDYEKEPKFLHLGKRFIPKNIGYALVISAMADVFVTRLARSGKMVGYRVQPVDSIPPDVNTITFLMNPAYTMNGSLDGMTGSSATTDRFFKHVPEMRSQYGSLYPASYYRLQEAYDLKRQIEAEDKRREAYFSNFNVGLVDETSLNREIDSGDAPTTIEVKREEDKPDTQMTQAEREEADKYKAKQAEDEAADAFKNTNAATKAKQAEIQNKIGDQKQRVQATNSFANWQKRMEDIQIRAGKRNIVNTYVWDADGGLRTEAQSFANTIEHTIGGSFNMNAGLGGEGKFKIMGGAFELSAQANINLTQTMSKTEARSKGFQLNVDLSGVEFRGITDYNDNPMLPGEKVDRYRFMSFYLEGSTQNFQDFFSYVVDPEWLRSNDEEARALRQAQAGKPNKAWRVLHRVTYVERPALMGFGRDVRKLRAAAEISENQQLLDKIAKLEENNRKLEEKLDKILDALKAQK